MCRWSHRRGVCVNTSLRPSCPGLTRAFIFSSITHCFIYTFVIKSTSKWTLGSSPRVTIVVNAVVPGDGISRKIAAAPAGQAIRPARWTKPSSSMRARSPVSNQPSHSHVRLPIGIEGCQRLQARHRRSQASPVNPCKFEESDHGKTENHGHDEQKRRQFFHGEPLWSFLPSPLPSLCGVRASAEPPATVNGLVS